MTDRRKFIQLAAAAGAVEAVGAPYVGFGASFVPDRAVEHGQPLSEFRYDQVKFASGLHETQREQIHEVLMNLSEDSLLRPYRVRAGLSTPGLDLAGWYSSDDLSGETLGQWISALSRFNAISSDEAIRSKIDRLVRALAPTFDNGGKVYGDPKITLGPAYMYDKLVCGLVDAHRFTGQPNALTVLAKATQAVQPLLPGHAVDYNLVDGGAHESYTLPENQFIAWQSGASATHLQLAKQYLYHSFFEPLSKGENVLGGRHAYSHVNSLSSAAKAYLVLGDESYLRAAQNGLAFVEAQSYATGGWGPNETFLPSPPSDWYGVPEIQTLADSLTQTHYHFETGCGCYAQFKLTRYLLRISKRSTYGDSMERVMYNTALGAKPLLKDGRAFYQSDYNPDGHKRYYDGDGGQMLSEWPCCSGTLSQLAADYRLGTYFQDSLGPYVNLFIPSTLQWRQGETPVVLTQSGNYPLGRAVSVVVTPARPIEFALRIRIPGWTVSPSVSVNGKRLNSSITPGTFVSIRREWRSGDRVEIEFPAKLALLPIDPQKPNKVALTYGPLVLFAVSPKVPSLSNNQLLSATRKSADASEWQVALPADEILLFVPFWEIPGVARYSTYIELSDA